MKTCRLVHHRPRRYFREGAIIVYAAVLMVLMFGILAFGIEVGRMTLDRTKLQLAVDAAVLAAASEMTEVDSASEVEEVIDFYLTANGIDASTLSADDLSIEYGYWDEGSHQFVASAFELATAIKVVCRLPNQRLIFGGFLGRDSFDAEANATANVATGSPQDVAMVIDCSTSMSSSDRMTLTRQAATILVDSLRSDDRVGLVVYSWPDPAEGGRKTGFLETPIQFDASATRSVIPSLTPGFYTSGTNIAGGMRAGLDELRTNNRVDPEHEPTKVMVVLTDGEANIEEPPRSNPFDSIDYFADLAAAENVIVHTVTLGDDSSQAAMQRVASVTGGLYEHVEDNDFGSLEAFFKRIGLGIGRPLLVD